MMKIELGNGKVLKAIILSNITVLIGTVVTLIWNAAVLNQRVAVMEANQERITRIQQMTTAEQARIQTRIEAAVASIVLVDDRIIRLENLHFDRPLGPPVFRIPPDTAGG